MVRNLSADVIVVGAGTAGCYFAWQVSQAGLKVLVLESRKLADLGRHIEIFHMDQVRFDEFSIPHPLPPELIHTEEIGYTWSPDRRVRQPIRYTFYVMDMPAFIQRLQGYAAQSGVTFKENSRVERVLVEDGCVCGVAGTCEGVPFEARSRLVVDASGLAAAVRTRLPSVIGVETNPVPPGDCLFVCLELRDNFGPGYPSGSNSYLYHKAFWNKSYGEGAILGIGQPKSFEFAWQKHKEWREEYFGSPGDVLKRRQGVIPYHRPPFSLVGNGLMVIGDAANQNKPFSGEGVTSGFTAAKIASEVAINQAKSEAPGQTAFSREAMWGYNVRYFRGQGAKFAAGLAQLPAVAELTRKDVNYLFRHNIIFSSADFEELNLNYEIQMGTAKMLKTALVLLQGVACGQFAWVSLKKFLAASSQAGKIKAHYLKYPQFPSQFAAWEAEARCLWGESRQK